eukprot:767815-Lingulodinium_polyedra.AAC.1
MSNSRQLLGPSQSTNASRRSASTWQRISETVKTYINREELVWHRLRDASRALYGSDTETE